MNIAGESFFLHPIACWEILHAFLSSTDFFSKIFQESTINVLNSMDPDHHAMK